MLVSLLPGGLGDLNYPLVADLKKEISEKYGVLTGEGRWLSNAQQALPSDIAALAVLCRVAVLLISRRQALRRLLEQNSNSAT